LDGKLDYLEYVRSCRKMVYWSLVHMNCVEEFTHYHLKKENGLTYPEHPEQD
jgi:hypothetical protein